MSATPEAIQRSGESLKRAAVVEKNGRTIRRNPPLGMVAALLAEVFGSLEHREPKTFEERFEAAETVDFLISLVSERRYSALIRMAHDQRARESRRRDDDPTQLLRIRNYKRRRGEYAPPSWVECDDFETDESRAHSINLSIRKHRRKIARRLNSRDR